MIQERTDKVQLTMILVPAIKGQMEQRFLPLVETIRSTTGYDIALKEASTYDAAAEALISGEAQVGWLGQNLYLEIAQRADIEPFAVASRDPSERSTYVTVFITRRDEKISSLDNIRGKRLILSERGSTSGDVVPRHSLALAGIEPTVPTNFSQIHYAGSQEAAVSLILSGAGDVAAISEINYDALIGKGRISKHDVKIIHRTLPIPGAPLVYSRGLPEMVKKSIREAVLNAHKAGKVGGYGEVISRYETVKKARLDFLRSYLHPQIKPRTVIALSAFVLLTVFISLHLGINPFVAMADSARYFVDITGRMLPPDFSHVGGLLLAMLETIEIGALGTILATIISIPIGLASAKNVAPHMVIYYPARIITTFFRAVPEFIMAMILVISVGFGAMPGVIALGLHTMGFLSKFYAEEIEHVNTGPIDALNSSGASRLQTVMYAIVPQILPSFVGYSLYILDRNIRMATMLGIVGAGGIGYRLLSSFRMFEYRTVSAIIIIIFVTIFFIDLVSSKIRLKIK